MLLRRVIEHVKSQSWVAIGIDLVIVVVGVFIGIQVSNWNGDIENRRVAAGYVERLKVDLQLEIDFLNRGRDYIAVTRNYSALALDAYASEDRDPGIDFLVDLYQASQSINLILERGTYDELLATGRIIHIRNEKLRSIFSNHYGRFAGRNATFVDRSDYRQLLRQNMAHTVQAAVRTNCGDVFGQTEENVSYLTLPASCDVELNLPDELVTTEVRLLLQNDAVRKELRFHLSVLDSKLNSIQAGLVTAEETIRAIEQSGDGS